MGLLTWSLEGVREPTFPLTAVVEARGGATGGRVVDMGKKQEYLRVPSNGPQQLSGSLQFSLETASCNVEFNSVTCTRRVHHMSCVSYATTYPIVIVPGRWPVKLPHNTKKKSIVLRPYTSKYFPIKSTTTISHVKVGTYHFLSTTSSSASLTIVLRENAAADLPTTLDGLFTGLPDNRFSFGLV